MTLQRSQPRHSVRPSLLLDFANGKTLDPRIDFTRASTASFYDGETYAKAEENLLRHSQDATQWSSSNATITGDTQTAPDGTTTADTYESLGDVSSLSRTLSVSAPFTHSIFVKYVDTQYFRLRTSGPNTATWFDIQNGTVGTDQHDSSSITDVGNGWYRLSITENTTDTIGVQYFLHDTNGSLTEVAGTAYIWGAQLEQRDSLTAYTPTTDQPITNYIPALQTAQNNQARFDHDPVTEESLGLLIEEQRTNLLSDPFSSSWNNIGITESNNANIAPDGTQTALLIQDDLTNNQHTLYNNFTVANTGDPLTFSCYFKKFGDTEEGVIFIHDTGVFDLNIQVRFNLINGTVGQETESQGTILNTGIKNAGNNWYRCFVTAEPSSPLTTSTVRFHVRYDRAGASGNYQGDGYSGVFVWGGQIEQNASFPTSYIPTSGSTATRNADSAEMTGTNFSSWYRQDEGTLYAEVDHFFKKSSNGFNRSITLVGDDPDRNDMGFYKEIITSVNSEDIQATVRKNNTVEASLKIINQVTDGYHKLILALKENDVAATADGSAVSTDSSVTLVTAVKLLMFGRASFQPANSGYVKKIAYYPQRLTNEELQRLTEA